MSLIDTVPGDKRGIDHGYLINALWGTALTMLLLMAVLYLLNRIGLPGPYVVGLLAITLTGGIAFLSTIGRTMTGVFFFFGGRIAGIAPCGLGGITDWLGGAFLALFFSLAIAGGAIAQISLVAALLLGLALQSTLLVLPFHRTQVATLPGFFAWRYRSQWASLPALLVVTVMLALFAFAEFQIARDVLINLTGLDQKTAAICLLVLAVLPSLSGGWLGLIFVNAAFGICLLIAALLPAVLTGFFPTVLQTVLPPETAAGVSPPLTLYSLPDGLMAFEGPGGAIVTTLVLGFGFAVLPHALARLSTTANPIDAIESQGWSALSIFLLLSALPLSVGLIVDAPASNTTAALLLQQPVLQILAKIAFLFAALNALATCLFVASATVVRAFRRSRRRDPGDRSIFPTRALTVLFAIALFYVPSADVPAAPELLVLAICLGAAGLFLPVICSIWVGTLPGFFAAMATICGALALAVLLYGSALGIPEIPQFKPVMAAAAALLASGTVILLGYLWRVTLGKKRPDVQLAKLRSADPIH